MKTLRTGDRGAAVKKLQQMLKKAGRKVDVDGAFGPGTLQAVQVFQAMNELEVDGVVGAATWAALEAVGGHEKAPELEGFRGDLGWVHEREGHAGKPYWPGGASGVTLDPGIDIGHARASLVEAAFAGLVDAKQFRAIQRVAGIKGEAAKAALAGDPVLKSIRISRDEAEHIFPYAAKPYWQAICKRFPALEDERTPGSVHTAFLSLAYNRGAGNKGLKVLAKPLEAGDWDTLASLIATMQQDHKLAGIRSRRRMEAGLISEEIA